MTSFLKEIKNIQRIFPALILITLVFHQPFAAPTHSAATSSSSLKPTTASLRDTVQQLRDSLAHLKDSLRNIRDTDNTKVTGNTFDTGNVRDTLSIRHKLNLAPDEKTPKSEITEEQAHQSVYLVNAAVDLQHAKVDSDNEKLAALLFVGVGVVVVGAFIIYGGKTIYDLITNADDNPLFKEVGLRYSYSAKSSAEGEPNFYSQANLVGLKFAIGIKKPGMNLGVAAEGGYIGLSYEGLNLSGVVDYNGGYLVVGPLIRFGQNEPYSFTMEFLNGTSTHPSIGWISKSRMILQQRINTTGFLLGIHLGAVFYDLSLKDGLGQKDGSLNRDLSLIYGLESSWEF